MLMARSTIRPASTPPGVDAQNQVKRADSDEAVVYPAKVDLSWVDAKDKE
jgi:hypothetical protein